VTTDTDRAPDPAVDGDAPPVLRIDHVAKHFGAIRALEDVAFDLHRGEVIGLVGDNGAGKSTLIKIISGVYPPSAGRVLLDGEETHFASPAEARDAGIETVYQDLGLVDNLDVTGNFFLGRELEYRGFWKPFGFLRNREMRDAARDAIAELKVEIPGKVTQRVEEMSGGQRQGIAIARAAFWKRRLLLLDEPTAALGVRESAQVIKLIKRMASEEQLPMIVISHNMDDVMQICDTIVVLRQGVQVAQLDRRETTASEVVGYITGALS